jgi:tetratricopeptide (TPR) repeat protein
MNFIIFQIRRFLTFLTDAFLFPFLKFRELWSDPKRGRALVFGLPALLVAVTGIVMMLIAMSSEQRFITNYEIAKQRAERDEDWAAAIVYMRKIMQLRPDDDATKWELARVLDLDDREETAETNKRTASAILLSLSPEDAPGYPKAHVWRASQYLTLTDRRIPDKWKREQAEKQLRFALDTDPTNRDAKILLAEKIYIPEREYAKALKIYEEMFRDYVGYYVKIAELCMATNQPERGEEFVEDAVNRYNQLLKEDPGNVTYLRRRANAYAMLGDYDSAEQTLLDAIDQAEDPLAGKQLQTALSRIYLARAMTVANLVQTDSAGRAKFLDDIIRAYRTDPENDAARTSLARFGFSGFDESPRALETYDPRDNPEDANDDSLTVAGTWEVMNGDRLLGIRLLELAVQDNPANHEALNNLAFTIMDADLNRAVGLAERAVAARPANPQYRDTRGNIYMRMGEWTKAVSDLEVAAKGMEKKEKVYEALIECFRQLQMISEAESYQKRLDELRRQEANSTSPNGPVGQ